MSVLFFGTSVFPYLGSSTHVESSGNENHSKVEVDGKSYPRTSNMFLIDQKSNKLKSNKSDLPNVCFSTCIHRSKKSN